MKGEAENGVMQPQAEEPLGAGRGRKETSLEPPEGARPWRHLDFGLLASRTVRE